MGVNPQFFFRSVCYKIYRQESARIHLQTHGSEHPFCCGLCATKFTDKNQLHIHIHIKHGIRQPFEIDESWHAKAKCADMTDHKETHEIRQPSLWGLRGIEFKVNNQLDIHVHTKNGSRHPICCSLCVTKTNNNQLDIHVQTKHGSRHPFRWGLCGIKSEDKNQLDIHLQTHRSRHQFCCGLCGKIFTNENQSNIHDQSEHGRTPGSLRYRTIRQQTKPRLTRLQQLISDHRRGYIRFWLCQKISEVCANLLMKIFFKTCRELFDDLLK